MALQQPPELHSGWKYEDDPADPGTATERDQRWRADWAKQQGNGGHFMDNGKKKYYKLVRVRS